MTKAELSQLCLCNGMVVLSPWCIIQVCSSTALTPIPCYSHGEPLHLLHSRPGGGGQAGGLPAPRHQPAHLPPAAEQEHRQQDQQGQPEQEADHQDAPRHHPRLHRLLVSQVVQQYLQYICSKDSDIFPKFYQIFSLYRFLINMIKWVAPTLGWEFNATQPFYYFSRIAKLLPVIHAMLNPIIYR